ncbi:hypothetical protein ACFC4G_09035 [Streptomyces sp. NPDC056002]|uniref:hypothetical protein n=1 Tax=Streptomyces sp. NPDC056002 TaxID=3345675 RepID=UPI0035DB9F2C
MTARAAKLEAAASVGRPVQLLSLLALGDCLAEAGDKDRLAALHSQPSLIRGTQRAP